MAAAALLTRFNPLALSSLQGGVFRSVANNLLNSLYVSGRSAGLSRTSLTSLTSCTLQSLVSSRFNYIFSSLYTSPILDKQIVSSLSNTLTDVIFQLKRTFQPSLIRRKRKHGFLARKNSRHGLKIIHRRLEKGRRALCA